MEPNESPYQVSRSQAGGPAPSFLVRLLALPFWPKLWREAPESGAGAIFVLLALWSLAAAAVFGVHVANGARNALQEAASYYEANADPLQLEGGRFSLAGDRILRFEDPNQSFMVLIDSEETVPEDEITSRNYF